MGAATTKHDLIKRVAAETQASRNVVRQVVQQFLDDVVEELAAGHRIEFRDFGVFEVVRRKPRVARNPRTGEAIQVPAKTVVHFKQGRVMKEKVGSLENAGAAPGSASAEGERGPAEGPRPSPPAAGLP